MLFEPLRRVEIPNNEPYKNDALEHRKTAEVLMAIIKHTKGPSTIAIDGPWGSGKTTLLRMLSADIARQRETGQANVPCVVSFNAWETEGSENPLLALLGEVAKALPPEQANDRTTAETLKALRRKAMVVGKAVLPTIAKGIAGKLIGTETVPEIAEKLAEVGTASFAEQRQAREDFKTQLATLAARVGGSLPLVIAVDELDRCRPPYAIEFLETLEHLFGVPGVVFLLAMNKQQLARSVCGVYGSTFDGAGYLRRFIDVDFPMPEPRVDAYANVVLQSLGFADLLKNIDHGYERTLSAVEEAAAVFHFSLRDINQLLQRLKIVLHQDVLMWPELTVFLLALREVQPEHYAVVGQGAPGEFIDKLAETLQQPDFADRRGSTKIEALLMLGHAKSADRDEHQRLLQKYRETDSDRARTVVGTYDRHGRVVDVCDYRQCVEFASRFRFSA